MGTVLGGGREKTEERNSASGVGTRASVATVYALPREAVARYLRAYMYTHIYHARFHLRATVRGGPVMASRSTTQLATVRERAQAR
eukprot:6177425-Pleurochrysis_carterae.AAC.3